MKKFFFTILLILLGFIYISFCFLEIVGFFDSPKTVIYTFDATKDTSFIVDRHGKGPSVILNVDGYLSDTALINVFTYLKGNKYEKDLRSAIKLYPGKVHKKDLRPDFYDNQAIIHYWHLNNKKGKLKISASL